MGPTLIFRLFCWGRRCLADREHEGTRRGEASWPVKSRCLVCGHERQLVLPWGDVEKWHREYAVTSA